MTKQKPEPCTDLAGKKYGLLSPTGEFYPCGWHEHNFLAFRVGNKSCSALMSEGWLMLTHNSEMRDGEVRDWPLWYRGLEGIGRHWKPSAKQAETILEWCAANGEKYPEEFME